MTRERDIEAYLKRELEALGCYFLKWVSPGNAGVPDRILILPIGVVAFIEVKTDTGRLSGLQHTWKVRLRTKGCAVLTIYGQDEAEAFVFLVKGLLHNGV